MADAPEVPQIEKKIGPVAIVLARALFSGSFQCRLATQPDPTTFSPTDKEGKLGVTGLGWTFAYREKAFDRVIRFSNPVQLRNALMDPWEDVKVKSVEVNTTRGRLTMGGGLTPVGDPLVGQVVSLGDAKFDTKLGASFTAREAISGLSLSIGGGMLTAQAGTIPPLCQVMNADVRAWAQEYEVRKPKLIEIAKSQMDPVRREYLENKMFQNHLPDGLPYSFDESGDYIGELKNLRCTSASAFDPKKWLDIPFTWTIDLTFFRYDGDTLTGRVAGQIYAAARK
jgi:hypothetical protein